MTEQSYTRIKSYEVKKESNEDYIGWKYGIDSST